MGERTAATYTPEFTRKIVLDKKIINIYVCKLVGEGNII